MRNQHQGFTLVELMITVATIGILSVVCIQSYQDYIIRARLSKIPCAIEGIKLAIAEYGTLNGRFDFTPDDWLSPQASQGLGLENMPLPTNEISSYSLGTDGTVTLTLQNIGSCANSKTITWRPNIGAGIVTWIIGGSATGGTDACSKEIARWA